MKSQYSKGRPTIPAEIRRSVAVESGHACAIKDCLEHTYNEYHHIDGNRENNNPENLIYLCDKHHKMAHKNILDRKALREYKRLNDLSRQVRSTASPNEEQLMRSRDIEKLEWILSTIHFPTLDEHVQRSPRVLDDNVLTLSDKYNSVLMNSLFDLYDVNLKRLFTELYTSLNESTKYYQHYRLNHNASAYYFSNPGDAPLTEEQEPAWEAIEKANSEIYQIIQEILAIIRSQYIEVDIISTNEKAWQYLQS